MTVERALARTVDLVRADVYPLATDEEVVTALAGTRIRLVADERNLSCLAGQTALVTSAIVAAQSGATLVLSLPDIQLLHQQPPLRGAQIGEALVDYASDLIAPAIRDEAQPCDLTIAFGTTPMPSVSGAVARIAPIADGFELVPGDATPVCNWAGNKLFAALFGGVAVGAEAFRAAMRRIAASGHKPTMAHAARDLRPAQLLIREPTSTHALERLDVISGGAISHGLLFALLRVPEIEAALRIFDHDKFDWPNLNRYLLGRRSFQGKNKAELLAGFSRPGLDITYVPSRFDDEIAVQVALAEWVAVGVDDIPSRWRVQDVAPGLVVVGATSHFEVVVSEHPPNTACARCLYPDGEDDGRPIPTVSFVSAFAGILQAHRLLSVAPTEARQTRVAPVNLAGDRPLIELGVMPRRVCAAGCQARVAPE